MIMMPMKALKKSAIPGIHSYQLLLKNSLKIVPCKLVNSDSGNPKLCCNEPNLNELQNFNSDENSRPVG